MADFGPFPAVTIDDEIADMKREIVMRKQVYWNQFAAGKLTRDEAEKRIACSLATLVRLEKEKQSVTDQQLRLF